MYVKIQTGNAWAVNRLAQQSSLLKRSPRSAPALPRRRCGYPDGHTYPAGHTYPIGHTYPTRHTYPAGHTHCAIIRKGKRVPSPFGGGVG